MSTPITLDTPGTGGPPGVKFPEPGTFVVVGIVNVEEYHQHNIDGVAQTWSDGSPKMGKAVTGLVVSASGATVSGEAGERPVETGELVRFFCEGGRWFTWQDAVKKAGAANVGDVMKWTFDHEEPPKQRGYNGQKVYVAAIRSPKPEDGDLADRCVAAYHEQKARPALDSGPQAAAQDQGDPFGDAAPTTNGTAQPAGVGAGPAASDPFDDF